MSEPIIIKGNKVFVLDQRLLPKTRKMVEIGSADDGFLAIKDMIVRGAPLIGVVAFYSLAIEALKNGETNNLLSKADKVASARPTAVNLKYAIEQFKNFVLKNHKKKDLSLLIFEKARKFHQSEIEATNRIAEKGLKVFKKKSRVLTYCNAGSLATTGLGTALGVIKMAFRKGLIEEVFACETSPYYQGLRLTAFELEEEKIPYKVLCDNTAGFIMTKKGIDLVIVGADRIAFNGDTANKIGTYTLSVLCKENKIPFYVAAPISTIDLSTKSGSEIKIEERNGKEIYNLLDEKVFNKSYKTLYYGFDITPSKYISAIITDQGVVESPYQQGFKKFLKKEKR